MNQKGLNHLVQIKKFESKQILIQIFLFFYVNYLRNQVNGLKNNYEMTKMTII